MVLFLFDPFRFRLDSIQYLPIFHFFRGCTRNSQFAVKNKCQSNNDITVQLNQFQKMNEEKISLKTFIDKINEVK